MHPTLVNYLIRLMLVVKMNGVIEFSDNESICLYKPGHHFHHRGWFSSKVAVQNILQQTSYELRALMGLMYKPDILDI